MLLAQLAHLPRLQRIEVVDALHFQAQHRPHRDRVAKRMKEGENPQQHVGRLEPHDVQHGFHIRGDVAVRQHDPLRLTCRPRREDDRQQVVARDLVQTQPANQQPARHDVTGQAPSTLSASVTLSRRSSSMTSSAFNSKPNFSITLRLVSTCRMPA